MTVEEPDSLQTEAPKSIALQNLDREKIVNEHIVWMLGLAGKILNDHSLAQDVTQEAFIKAFRAHDSLRDPTRLKPWLKRILINTALMQLRQIKRRTEDLITEDLPEFDKNGCRIEGRWTYLIGTEKVVESVILRSTVHQAFSQLSEEYRIVLLLRDIEGYDTGEVALMLDMTISNVKTRLHRARSALKKRLEPTLRGDVS